MAKVAIIFDDTKDKSDFSFDLKFIELSEEEREKEELTKAGMAAFLTAYVIEQGHLENFKDEFIKFQRDMANEHALRKLEEEKAQKRIDNGVARKDDKKD